MLANGQASIQLKFAVTFALSPSPRHCCFRRHAIVLVQAEALENDYMPYYTSNIAQSTLQAEELLRRLVLQAHVFRIRNHFRR